MTAWRFSPGDSAPIIKYDVTCAPDPDLKPCGVQHAASLLNVRGEQHVLQGFPEASLTGAGVESPTPTLAGSYTNQQPVHLRVDHQRDALPAAVAGALAQRGLPQAAQRGHAHRGSAGGAAILGAQVERVCGRGRRRRCRARAPICARRFLTW